MLTSRFECLFSMALLPGQSAGGGGRHAADADPGRQPHHVGRRRGHGQGLTLVHFSAQSEPFLTQNAPQYIPLNTPRISQDTP